MLHLPLHHEIEDDTVHWMLGIFNSAMARLQAPAA